MSGCLFCDFAGDGGGGDDQRRDCWEKRVSHKENPQFYHFHYEVRSERAQIWIEVIVILGFTFTFDFYLSPFVRRHSRRNTSHLRVRVEMHSVKSADHVVWT